jgi:ATP-dependent protease HslVU (ClpYQ) peptidase subunit
MTCIAYRDGVMAGDRLVCGGDAKLYYAAKIVRGPDGALAGFAGLAPIGAAFLAWVRGGREGEQPKLSDDDKGVDHAIIVEPDGRITKLEGTKAPFHIETPYIAIGCGGAEARGAMFVGAGAEMAVRAAIAHDAFCGGDVDVVKLADG